MTANRPAPQNPNQTGEVVNSSVVHVYASPLDCDMGLKKVGGKENTRVFDSENLTSVGLMAKRKPIYPAYKLRQETATGLVGNISIL